MSSCHQSHSRARPLAFAFTNKGVTSLPGDSGSQFSLILSWLPNLSSSRRQFLLCPSWPSQEIFKREKRIETCKAERSPQSLPVANLTAGPVFLHRCYVLKETSFLSVIPFYNHTVHTLDSLKISQISLMLPDFSCSSKIIWHLLFIHALYVFTNLIII